MKKIIILLAIIVGVGLIVQRIASPPEPSKAPPQLSWPQRAQEMSKWRSVDWDRWKSLTGATNDEVLRQQAAVWLEIERQKKGQYPPSKK